MKKDKGRPDGYNNQSYNGNMSSGASANWVSNSIKKTLGKLCDLIILLAEFRRFAPESR
jgi:hypothetical protein